MLHCGEVRVFEGDRVQGEVLTPLRLKFIQEKFKTLHKKIKICRKYIWTHPFEGPLSHPKQFLTMLLNNFGSKMSVLHHHNPSSHNYAPNTA